MRIITHSSLIKRNAQIGRFAFIGGMVLLVGAFILNLMAISRPTDVSLLTYVLAAFLVGFLLTNISTYFNNRWGRRPDRGLSEALKGLDERYSLYHYRLGTAHVLVGPGGVFVFHPKYQRGPIVIQNNKWVAPAMPRAFFNLFNSDPLGNPAREAAYEAENLNTFLKKHAPDLSIIPQPLIVFMSPRAEVSAKESPVPALHVKQLKDYVRRQPKGPTLNATQLSTLETSLGLKAINDA